MTSFDEIVTVRVCLKCGRGYPPWSEMMSTRVDSLAVWWTQSESGPRCNGRLMDVERGAQIESVETEQFMLGAQWTEEQTAAMRARQEREPS